MHWEIGMADHIGGRSDQEDRIGSFVSDDAKKCLILVADGMGGHADGELAAQAVIDIGRSIMEQRINDRRIDAETLLRHICLEANAAIRRLSDNVKRGPRATCAIFLADEADGHWVSVGDSRLYRFRGHEVVERTIDQSVVQMLVDLGRITEAEMAHHPDQGRVLESLGGEDDPHLVFGRAKLRRADSVLLCTDGLWENSEPTEMAAACMAEDMEEAATKLVSTAAERGGSESDNIAMVMARLVPDGRLWPWRR